MTKHFIACFLVVTFMACMKLTSAVWVFFHSNYDKSSVQNFWYENNILKTKTMFLLISELILTMVIRNSSQYFLRIILMSFYKNLIFENAYFSMKNSRLHFLNLIPRKEMKYKMTSKLSKK